VYIICSGIFAKGLFSKCVSHLGPATVQLYGCYNSKIRSGLLNNSTNQKYCGPGSPNLHNPTRKIQKNVGQVWKITNFDPQTALFDNASMEVIT
jgi:hypothetical protein